mgnify:CR=1 FL=1
MQECTTINTCELGTLGGSNYNHHTSCVVTRAWHVHTVKLFACALCGDFQTEIPLDIEFDRLNDSITGGGGGVVRC